MSEAAVLVIDMLNPYRHEDADLLAPRTRRGVIQEIIRTLAATRPAKVGPLHVTTGRPVHNASDAVVCAL